MQQNQNPNKVAATEAPRRVISLLVDNHNGVLARVSSLFCRRGFNIDSLTVSATNDPAVSRITVTLHGDDAAISQLILQTERLEVTRQIFELTPDKSLQRELLLLKVACNTAERAEMREIAATVKLSTLAILRTKRALRNWARCCWRASKNIRCAIISHRLRAFALSKVAATTAKDIRT